MSHHSWARLSPPATFRYPPLSVQARGDYAVFTRPEFTSERLSYPIMTPTAAIGLLSAIFWKPQIRWVVDRIEVLAPVQPLYLGDVDSTNTVIDGPELPVPVRWMGLRRNEAGTAITPDHRKAGYLNVDEVVQQRMTTMLRDVHYRIHANVWVHPEAEEQNPAKWRDQFARRVDRGQSFRTPFLGMREFHADVSPTDNTPAVDWTEDLGIMLHSVTYDDRTAKETYDWFEASVDRGTMRVPRMGLIAAQNAEVVT